jgi:hypothetical protein
VLDELSELQRTTRFSYDNQDLPFTGEARRCYLLWLEGEPCYPELDYPADANLFLYNALNLERTQDDAGRVDYELPNFNYVTTESSPPGSWASPTATTGPAPRASCSTSCGRRWPRPTG